MKNKLLTYLWYLILVILVIFTIYTQYIAINNPNSNDWDVLLIAIGVR